jgi:hypothetical protein
MNTQNAEITEESKIKIEIIKVFKELKGGVLEVDKLKE